MSNLIRVRDKHSGHAYTIPAATLDTDQHEHLTGVPAVDANGRPLPPTPTEPITPKTAAAAKKENK